MEAHKIVTEARIYTNTASVGAGGIVTIVDQDSISVASVTAPGTYNVMRFDTISGGAPDTVYTTTITPPFP